MLNLNESIAPTPTTVNDLAGIIRQQLIGMFAVDCGYEGTLETIECHDPVIRQVWDDLTQHLRNDAYSTFKEWAKDESQLYNGDLALRALDELFEAVRSASHCLSPAYKAWLDKYGEDDHTWLHYIQDTTADMRDGNFKNIIDAWNMLQHNGAVDAITAINAHPSQFNG